MCTVCNLSIAFNVQHPLTLSVAVATRRAIDAGELDAREQRTAGALPHDDRAEAIAGLQGLQRRIENVLTPEELVALPDFFVLMIETRTWGFYHPSPTGFATDADPLPPRLEPGPNGERDAIILVTETAMRPFLAHRQPYREAADRGWLMIDADADRFNALDTMLDRIYPRVGLSQFVCA